MLRDAVLSQTGQGVFFVFFLTWLWLSVCSAVINKQFLLLLPLSCSFFPGVLRGDPGAAVHYLPQGSSVLQTALLSGATCRYGKPVDRERENKREKVAFVLSFPFLKVTCVLTCWDHAETERSVGFNLHGYGKRTWINLIWSLSGGNGFASVKLAALRR